MDEYTLHCDIPSTCYGYEYNAVLEEEKDDYRSGGYCE